MARYVDTVITDWTAEDAFSYMADARNFAEWDPGTRRVEQVAGDGPGPNAEYDVTVDVGPRATTLRYRVTRWEPTHVVVLEAENAVLHLRDEITVDHVGTDVPVTYDATVTLKGPLSLLDRLLERGFEKTGRRAAAGLRARVQRPR
jgi:hypothetical protein